MANGKINEEALPKSELIKLQKFVMRVKFGVENIVEQT